MEVYCGNCKYHLSDCSDYCSKGFERDYMGRKDFKRCSSKNVAMNCQDYKRKWYKFWLNVELERR